MDPDLYSYFNILARIDITLYPITIGISFGILVILLLLAASALVSGSEIAFFSLSPGDLIRLKEKKSKKYKMAQVLVKVPEKLLAAILIANNFINVAIVIISTYITSSLVNYSNAPVFGFIMQVVVITFLLLLFGEILPKVYAARYALPFSLFMAYPLNFALKLFKPLISVMVKTTSWVNARFIQRSHNISIRDLSHALELTSGSITEDKSILHGIVKFGNIDVKEIMRSRMDIFAIDIETSFTNILRVISESGYSRIPVYQENIDNIKGILFIKDLLPHLNKDDEFTWENLIRSGYYVPENKKINALLHEFQTNKIHMAVVIDEYGGTSGLVTLEDILEEIVGEITDESDEEEEIFFSQEDDSTYLFEGKILLHDFYRILNIEENIFDDVKQDADTLAGLILELRGEIPEKNSKIKCKNYTFTVVSADKRRIKQIRVEKDPDPAKAN